MSKSETMEEYNLKKLRQKLHDAILREIDLFMEKDVHLLAAALGVLEADSNTTEHLDDDDLQEEYDQGRNLGAKLPGGVDYEDPIVAQEQFDSEAPEESSPAPERQYKYVGFNPCDPTHQALGEDAVIKLHGGKKKS